MDAGSVVRRRNHLLTVFLALGAGCGGRSNLSAVADAGRANTDDATVVGGDASEAAAEAGPECGGEVGPQVDAGGEGPPDDGGECGSGQVTFQVAAPGGVWAVADWFGADYGCFWLTLSNADGSVLDLDNPTEVKVDCRDCTSKGRAIGCGYEPVGDAGVSITWNGEHFTLGTCGSTSTTCAAPTCAPPGQYVATMCGFPESGSGPQQCIEVPFTYPSASTVTGIFPNGDF